MAEGTAPTDTAPKKADVSTYLGNKATKNTKGYIGGVIAIIVILGLVIIVLFSMLAYKYNNPPPKTEVPDVLQDTKGLILVANASTPPTLSLVSAITAAGGSSLWSFSNGTISTLVNSTTTYYITSTGGDSVGLVTTPTDGSVWTYDGIVFANVITSKYLCSNGSVPVLSETFDDPITFNNSGYTEHFKPYWVGLSTSLGIIFSVLLVVICCWLLGVAMSRIRKVNKIIATLLVAVSNGKIDDAKKIAKDDLLQYLPNRMVYAGSSAPENPPPY